MAETIQSWLTNPTYQQARAGLMPILQEASAKYGVPVELLDYLTGVESRWGAARGLDRPGAAGELGIFQQTPAFRQDYGVTDPLDPRQQAAAAAQALRGFYDRTGDWGDTLVGYNRGLGGLQHYLQNERQLSTQPSITANYRAGYDAFLDAIRGSNRSSLADYSRPVREALDSQGLRTYRVPDEAAPLADLSAVIPQENMEPLSAALSFDPGRQQYDAGPMSVAEIEAAFRRIDNA